MTIDEARSIINVWAAREQDVAVGCSLSTCTFYGAQVPVEWALFDEDEDDTTEARYHPQNIECLRAYINGTWVDVIEGESFGWFAIDAWQQEISAEQIDNEDGKAYDSRQLELLD